MQDQLPSGAGDRGRDGGESEAEPFLFPLPGLGGRVGEQAHPGGELGCRCDELAPGTVLIAALESQVAEIGVLAEGMRSSQRAQRP